MVIGAVLLKGVKVREPTQMDQEGKTSKLMVWADVGAIHRAIVTANRLTEKYPFFHFKSPPLAAIIIDETGFESSRPIA